MRIALLSTSAFGAIVVGGTEDTEGLATTEVFEDGAWRRGPTLLTPRVKLGIAISPEGRRLFKDLSVDDNLKVGGLIHPAAYFAQDRDKVLSLFPRLGERLTSLAGNLSGGEQQMLAIGRALMTRPRLLMIDEISLGLMPKVIDLCYGALEKLRSEGLTILVVEQNTDRLLRVADELCVLESGRAVWQGKAADARADATLTEAYLGLH